MALAYPEFNADCVSYKVFTISFEEMITVNISTPSRPVSVNGRIDWQGTTTFVAVKLKMPSVASPNCIHSNVSLVGDSKSGIVVQLVERAFLK